MTAFIGSLAFVSEGLAIIPIGGTSPFPSNPYPVSRLVVDVILSLPLLVSEGIVSGPLPYVLRFNSFSYLSSCPFCLT